MITIDLAKTQHHFIDADEAQDRIASSLAQSVQYTGKNLLISSVTLCVILFVSAGLIGYQLRSGVNPVYLIVAAVLLFLYMPRCLKVWQEYRDSSGIRLLEGKGPHHFLLCQAVCTRKNPVSRHVYSLRVRCSNESVLDDVLVSKKVYDAVQVKDRVTLLVCADAERSQVTAFPSSVFRRQEQAAQTVEQQPDTLRPMTPEERAFCQLQYEDRIRQRSGLYDRSYALIMLACAAAAAVGIVLRSNPLIYPPLFVIVLFAGILFMNHAEDARVKKALSGDGAVSCGEVRVTEHLHDSSQGYRTTFSCGDRIALTSRKREDFEWFSLHDPCLLVYIGREKPIPFKQ